MLAMTRKLINTKAPAADEVLWEDKKKMYAISVKLQTSPGDTVQGTVTI